MKDLSKLTRAERQAIANGILFNNRPVNSKYGYSQLQQVRNLTVPDFATILFWPDLHTDAKHEQARQVALRFAADLGLTINILAGDLGDQPNISRWPQPTNAKSYDLDREETQTGKDITEIHLATGALATYIIDGNHLRYQAYLNTVAGPLATLTNRDGSRVFNAKERMKISRDLPITHLAGSLNRGGFDGGLLINNTDLATHGNRSTRQPGGAARVMSDNLNISVHTGHTHKVANGARQTTGKGVIKWSENGFLADFRSAMMAYIGNLDKNWQLNLTVWTVAHDGTISEQLVPITPMVLSDGRETWGLVFGGKVYLATDY
ncbi:MAG: hypothetical protein K2X29_09095 [Candidatus Obscuribacterales bacterium]|nr:hypothetical protein [Candidatus Obscuribacterales bacterium]